MVCLYGGFSTFSHIWPSVIDNFASFQTEFRGKLGFARQELVSNFDDKVFFDN